MTTLNTPTAQADALDGVLLLLADMTKAMAQLLVHTIALVLTLSGWRPAPAEPAPPAPVVHPMHALLASAECPQICGLLVALPAVSRDAARALPCSPDGLTSLQPWLRPGLICSKERRAPKRHFWSTASLKNDRPLAKNLRELPKRSPPVRQLTRCVRSRLMWQRTWPLSTQLRVFGTKNRSGTGRKSCTAAIRAGSPVIEARPVFRAAALLKTPNELSERRPRSLSSHANSVFRLPSS